MTTPAPLLSDLVEVTPPGEVVVQLDMFGLDDAMSGMDYEVVEAPLSELGERGMPRNLRKANIAVHVYPTKGKYTLLMRRLFNALLALSHSKLKTFPEGYAEQLFLEQKVVKFEASGADIKRLIGQENVGDYEGLYEALSALRALPMVWDALAPDGERWTHNASLLAHWGRSETSGKVSWSWLPDVFWMLFNPKNPFTPLDLELSKKFHSKYTLALYENCFRYRKIGRTPTRDTRDWVLLIAGPDRYKDYREFKRSALKKAIEEMAKTVDCPITVEPKEEFGQFRRVERIYFEITLKKQATLEMDTPAGWNHALHLLLKRIPLADSVIQRLFAEYDPAYLERQLELMRKEQTRGVVKNPGAWFVSAVDGRYNDHLSLTEALTQDVLKERREKELEVETQRQLQGFREQEALAWLAGLAADERTWTVRRFLEESASPVRKRYEKDELESKMVRTCFIQWSCAQLPLSRREELQDLNSFKRFKALPNQAPAES